jgi:hypothetical protein
MVSAVHGSTGPTGIDRHAWQCRQGGAGVAKRRMARRQVLLAQGQGLLQYVPGLLVPALGRIDPAQFVQGLRQVQLAGPAGCPPHAEGLYQQRFRLPGLARLGQDAREGVQGQPAARVQRLEARCRLECRFVARARLRKLALPGGGAACRHLGLPQGHLPLRLGRRQGQAQQGRDQQSRPPHDPRVHAYFRRGCQNCRARSRAAICPRSAATDEVEGTMAGHGESET